MAVVCVSTYVEINVSLKRYWVWYMGLWYMSTYASRNASVHTSMLYDMAVVCVTYVEIYASLQRYWVWHMAVVCVYTSADICLSTELSISLYGYGMCLQCGIFLSTYVTGIVIWTWYVFTYVAIYASLRRYWVCDMDVVSVYICGAICAYLHTWLECYIANICLSTKVLSSLYVCGICLQLRHIPDWYVIWLWYVSTCVSIPINCSLQGYWDRYMLMVCVFNCDFCLYREVLSMSYACGFCLHTCRYMPLYLHNWNLIWPWYVCLHTWRYMPLYKSMEIILGCGMTI